jgi:hypothetical protein
MDALFIEQTAKTPFIELVPSSGKMEIRGKSIPENSKSFFAPVFDWIDAYGKNPATETTFEVQLDYFNTSSAKSIVDIFKKLEQIHKSGSSTVTINWRFDEDDGDMMEAGQDYQSIIRVNFNLIPFKQNN